MQTIAKLAHLGTADGRFPLAHVLGHVRRALSAAVERRATRPLQDIDDWSDQAEVAYYEARSLGHCP